jgi:hypothetical protein
MSWLLQNMKVQSGALEGGGGGIETPQPRIQLCQKVYRSRLMESTKYQYIPRD